MLVHSLLDLDYGVGLELLAGEDELDGGLDGLGGDGLLAAHLEQVLGLLHDAFEERLREVVAVLERLGTHLELGRDALHHLLGLRGQVEPELRRAQFVFVFARLLDFALPFVAFLGLHLSRLFLFLRLFYFFVLMRLFCSVFVTFCSGRAGLAAEWSDDPHCVLDECYDETVFLQTRFQEIVPGPAQGDGEEHPLPAATLQLTDGADATARDDVKTQAAVTRVSEAAPIPKRTSPLNTAGRSAPFPEYFAALATSVGHVGEYVWHVEYPLESSSRKMASGLSMLGLPEKQAGAVLICTLAFALICFATCAIGLASSLLNPPKQQKPEQKNRMLDREPSASFSKLASPMRPHMPAAMPGTSNAWPGPCEAASPKFPMSHVSLQSGPGPQSAMWSAPQSAVHSLPVSVGPSRASYAQGPPLCPELVVPDGSQVLFQVPSLLGQSLGEHRITDRAGEPILGLRLERQSPDVEMGALFDWRTGRPLGNWELGLSDRFCRLIRADGSPYAQVEEEAPGALGAHRAFRVTTAGVLRLRVQGRVHERSLTVASYAANVDRVMAAVVEPGSGGRGSDFYWLRIAPGVDAGLVALALSALDRVVGDSELTS